MKRHDFEEAVKSQINRYEAILALVEDFPSQIHNFNPPENYLYTLTEDACEFALQLTADFCFVDEYQPLD